MSLVNIFMVVERWTRALELEPNLASRWGFRGAAYQMKGHYNQAIADYTRALQLDPTNSSVKSRLEDIQELIKKEKHSP